jgi:Ca2+-binding RTX toxin-like protein
MSLANPYEQYMLELVNAERAKAGAQPLAFDSNLNTASENHSSWMISTDTFSHTGSGGSNPGARMTAAGYTFSGAWSWGENIAWASTRAPAGLQDEVLLLHTNLMNSSGHRANILNDGFREIGIGFEVGQYGSYEGAFVTQNFASTGTTSFLTGVTFDDLDGDKLYDPGEGLANLTISARNNSTGAIKTTTTAPAGGYDLELAAGSYTVTFSGGGFATTTQQATIGSKNVKLDLVDPVASGGTTTPPPVTPPPTTTPSTLTGTAGADSLTGSAGNDTILGLAGNDVLVGLGGNDKLDGGSGNDKLYGKEGADILTGGSGRDIFVFDTAIASGVDTITDFSSRDDTIYLENAVFTGLATGRLASSAFHVGAAAHDASDRIIYDKASGALYFDADGTGAIAAELFAQITPGSAVSRADFTII